MNRDLRNTSLSVQAAQLKRSLEKRDKRRQQDRVQRANQQDDGFSAEPQHTHPQPAQGHSAVAALNVISAADASLSAPSFSCELCKATFLTHVQHQQHLQSAVHRKALDKQAAEQARERSMASAGLNDMAAMAMGAAAWGATHSAVLAAAPAGRRLTGPGAAGPPPPALGAAADSAGAAAGAGGAGLAQQAAGSRARGVRPGQQQGWGGRQGQNLGAGPGQGQGAGAGQVTSHEAMLQAVRAGEEPLSIDGWVPPSVPLTQGSAEDEGPGHTSSSQSGAEEQGSALADLQPSLAASHSPAAAGAGASAEGQAGGGLGQQQAGPGRQAGVVLAEGAADLQELLEQAAQQYQYRHWGGLGDEAAQLPVGFADLNPAAEFELDLEQLAASLTHLPLTLLTGVPAAFLQGVDLQSAPAAGGQQQARQPGSSAGAAEQEAGVPPAAPLSSTHPCTTPSLRPGQPGRPGPPLPFTSMGSSEGSAPTQPPARPEPPGLDDLEGVLDSLLGRSQPPGRPSHSSRPAAPTPPHPALRGLPPLSALKVVAPSLPSGPHPTPLPSAGPPPLEPAKGLLGQLPQPHAVQASAGDRPQGSWQESDQQQGQVQAKAQVRALRQLPPVA
ncbi:hypothetical protein V8C86DRAFT_2440332 [Haematococcus lacustris]